MRLIAFYDAGQVQDIGQSLKWFDPVHLTTTSPTLAPYLTDPFSNSVFLAPLVRDPVTVTRTQVGKASAFKTSTGLEVRFFMPVLNVPFRLICRLQPTALRHLQQQPAASAEIHLQVRRRHDLLKITSIRRFPAFALTGGSR